MALTDPTTERYTTTQKSAVTARPRRGSVLHHSATTNLDLVISMIRTGSREVSADRAIKDNRNADFGHPELRAWSLSSAYWDSVLRSIECANESTAGWTISGASHDMMARQVAYWAATEGWKPSRSGDPRTWTVFGHREIYTIFGDSYATACPGGMDLDWVTKKSLALLEGGGTPPAPTPTPAPAPAKTTWVRAWGNEPQRPFWPQGDLMVRLQRALAGRTRFGEPSRYTGPDDGVGAQFTGIGIQKTLIIAGLWSGTPDGALGWNNALGVQEYGARFGGYRGPLDHDPRVESWTAFCRGLELP